MNFLQVIGECFPEAEVLLPYGNDPTVYSDIVWISTPIDQATIEAMSCDSGSSNVVADVDEPAPGDVIAFNGTEWVASSPTTTIQGHLIAANFSASLSLTSNRWMNLNDSSRPSNDLPFVVPFNCKLTGMTFANDDPNASITVEVYVVDESVGNGPSTKILDVDLDDVRTARVTNITEVSLNAGSKVAVYIRKLNGSLLGGLVDPSYPNISLYFQVTNDDRDTVIVDWSSTIST